MGTKLDLPPAGTPRVNESAWTPVGSDGYVNYHGKKVSDPETRRRLDELAQIIGQPVHVTSGDRTPEDQIRLRSQGKNAPSDSLHLQGKAADIWVEGMTPEEVAPFARQVGFTGIGVYHDGHLHVDTRPEPVRWDD